MIEAIIPYGVHDADDILLAEEGKELLPHTLAILKECRQIGSITVFSNFRSFPPATALSGVRFSYDPDLPGEGSLALPEQYRLWPTLLKPMPQTTHVLLITPRNPLLTTTLIEKVLETLSRNPEIEALASVVASSMHPCQLFYAEPGAGNNGAPLFLPDLNGPAEKKFFPNAPSLWHRNVDGSTTNLLTGRLILGRQDFPETVEPDGSFLLLNKKMLVTSPASVTPPLYGFKLSTHESIRMMTRFDFLRYRALLRAMDNEARPPEGNQL